MFHAALVGYSLFHAPPHVDRAPDVPLAVSAPALASAPPVLADDFIELNEPIFDTDKYDEFLRERKNNLGLFRKYLVCKFHDSWVIDIKQTDKSFSIVLNDF